MSLWQQIHDVGTPRETKADIIEYYYATYAGAWRQTLIQDLLGIRGVIRDEIGDKEYKRQEHNLRRRFDPDRIAKPEPRNAEEYRLLGESLPSMPPEGGYHIWGTVWVKYADNPCEEREVDEYITDEQAVELAEMANKEVIQAVVNHYMTDGDIHDEEPRLFAGDCQEPDLQVEAIEE